MKCIVDYGVLSKAITMLSEGETVRPVTFEENRWIECAKGIHFFMQRQEAIDYEY